MAQKFLQAINRQPDVTELPDSRLRVVRRLDVVDSQAAAKDIAKFLAEVELPWGTEDPTYTGCRLVLQKIVGQNETQNASPNNPPAYVLRTYEQIDASLETQVGKTDVSFDQYGRKTVTNTYIQFSTGTPVYETVGSSTAPAPDSACVLKEQIDTDDGTLRTIKRTYIDSGELSDNEELKFGGKLKLRTLTYLNEIPPTPSGYNLVTRSTEYIEGLPVYRYGFASAAAGSGSGGEISRSYTNNQGGNTAFDPANPSTATGEVVCTIRYLTAQSTTSNPITQPSGFVLFALDVQDEDGYRLWESKAGFGGGAAIQVSVDADPDGALNYTVQQNDDDGTTIPAYPGTGTAYNIKTVHVRDNGFFKNVAIWKKPPATDTYKQQMEFEEPGVASFTGSPPQFVLQPPKQRTLLVDVEVSFNTSQLTTTPFSIDAYAAFYETYTPTDTGVAVQSQRGLGGYLAGASGISGTNSNYNGVLCDSYQAALISSIPSSFPTGNTVLKINNEPYLTDVDGVKVYRRTKVSYSF